MQINTFKGQTLFILKVILTLATYKVNVMEENNSDNFFQTVDSLEENVKIQLFFTCQ